MSGTTPTHSLGKKQSAIRAMYTTHESDEEATAKADRLWGLMDSYLHNDIPTIQRSIVNHVEYTLACTRFNFDNFKAYLATSHAVRDRLIESWNDTNQFFAERDVKRINYLSMEYLMGRTLQNALLNLRLERRFRDALAELGYRLEELYDEEKDAALGNGGLGRLAACFLDSMATLNYPAWGYGIRYNYGMFRQKIDAGQQVEVPDYWLTFGNPWEIERQDVQYAVRFYGHVSKRDEDGVCRCVWEGGETVQAVAYDNPIPGFRTDNTINLRLWRATPSAEIDLAKFNQGDYVSAVQSRQRAELISSVLYPSDSTYHGKELRLKQQFFFVSATIQDIVRRFKKIPGRKWAEFPTKNAIQLNDTHPTIGIPELMRILVDEERVPYDDAWEITRATFAYTNHTLLPEALERWPVDMLTHVLPRHMQLIYDINWRFLHQVESAFPGDVGKLQRMSIIEEGGPKMVRMGHLAVVGAHTVNGVAAIHSELVQTSLFPDFAGFFPAGRFQNKTNGVTPRRWILLANPRLGRLFTRSLRSDEWLRDLNQLRALEPLAEDQAFRAKWRDIKEWNKARLAAVIEKEVGVRVPVRTLFDVHVKRIHEYKRQLLNCLYCVYRYQVIKAMTPAERAEVVPRAVVFAGKAAPSYFQAKRIIHLIHAVADKVNSDPDVGGLLKIVFLPNYNVSLAEVIIPAAELSQHISTAGMEASGTSNMKFAMNGSLIIGTMDGANIEIAEAIGKENMFIFGALASEVQGLRHKLRYGGPDATAEHCPEFQRVVSAVAEGQFLPVEEVQPILDGLRKDSDWYLLGQDFPSYLRAQEAVDELYRDQEAWTRASILSAVRMGYFSTDRTIHEYARDVWKLEPTPRPAPENKAGALRRARSNPSLNAYVSPSAAHPRRPGVGLSNLSELVRPRIGHGPSPPRSSLHAQDAADEESPRPDADDIARPLAGDDSSSVDFGEESDTPFYS